MKRAVRLEVTWSQPDDLTLNVHDKSEKTGLLPVLLFSLPLRRNPWHSTEILCEEIIRAYAKGEVEETLVGAPTPTSTQLHHWQFHLISPKRDQCRICEAQAGPRRTEVRRQASGASSGKVEIRRKGVIAATPSPISRTSKSATELGF